MRICACNVLCERWIRTAFGLNREHTLPVNVHHLPHIVSLSLSHTSSSRPLTQLEVSLPARPCLYYIIPSRSIHLSRNHTYLFRAVPLSPTTLTLHPRTASSVHPYTFRILELEAPDRIPHQSGLDTEARTSTEEARTSQAQLRRVG